MTSFDTTAPRARSLLTGAILSIASLINSSGLEIQKDQDIAAEIANLVRRRATRI